MVARRVIDISLVDVLTKYLGYHASDIVRDGTSNRYKTTCPFHNDHDPSFVLYDKTEAGEGWDYHCFVCGKHGVAPTMLVNKGLAKKDDEAISTLMRDFNLVLPDTVDLEHFSQYKGLNIDFLRELGWEDVHNGVKIPFKDANNTLISNKFRTKYTGKDKYYWQHHQEDNKNPAYGVHLLTEESYTEPLWVTEGETDCITLLQAGYRAIGIPGTNAWNSRYSEITVKFPYIIVAKDNDEAGMKMVADILVDNPDKVYILQLPDGIKDVNNFHLFRAKSKVDKFQGLMKDLKVLPANAQTFIKDPAELKTYRDVEAWKPIARQFNDNPIERAEFVAEFSKVSGLGKRDISSMLDKAGVKTAVRGNRISDTFSEDSRCYFKVVMRKDGSADSVQVSNFTIEPIMIKRIADGNDEYDVRIVKLHNVFNETTLLELEPEDLNIISKFKTKCTYKGKNIFYGNQEDLDIICNIIFNGCDRTVKNPLSIGRIDKAKNHWLFGNCGINTVGQVVTQAADSTITLDDTTYKPQRLADSEMSTDYFPEFDLSKQALSEVELADLLVKFRDNLGSYNAWVGLSWIVANCFSDVAYSLKRQFPFLFVIGQKNSGKTVFCRLLLKALGFSKNTGVGFEGTTEPAMERALTYLNSMPVWYDDYKDYNMKDPVTKKKADLFLSVFNRQSVNKASRDGMKLNVRPVNATVLLSGENSPTNSALKSRCVFLSMTSHTRDNALLDDVECYFDRLHMNVLHWMSQVQTRSAEYTTAFNVACETLRTYGFSNRTVEVPAVMLAGFDLVFKPFCTADDYAAFLEFFTASIKVEETTVSESHHLTQFFADLGSMLAIPNSGFRYHSNIILFKGTEIRIRKADLHNAWSKYRVDRGSIVNEDTLLRDITKSTFFNNSSTERPKHRFTLGTDENGNIMTQNAGCIQLDLPKMKATGMFDDFIEIVEQKSRGIEDRSIDERVCEY